MPYLGKPKVCTFAPGRRAWFYRLASGTYLVTFPGTADGTPGAQVGYIFCRPRAKRDDPLNYGVFPSNSPGEPEPSLYQGEWQRFAGAVGGLFAAGGR